MSRPRPTDVDDGSAAARLRAAMVDGLRERGDIRDPRVAAAFGRVPRHLFAPGRPVEAAYALDPDGPAHAHGAPAGRVSAAQLDALLLEQAGLERGMRCLEVGAGHTTALLAELVGPEGEVVAVDPDPEVIDLTARRIAAAGYRRVTLHRADAEHGAPEHAPFDRVIVTSGACDIPPAWIDQLTDDGAIVVPLRIRGLTCALVLEREDGHLVARSAKVWGFVPMRGAETCEEHLVTLGGRGGVLRFDGERPADPGPLAAALAAPRAEAWSGVRIGCGKPFELLELWLASVLDGFCLLSVDPGHGSGRVDPAHRVACPAMAAAGGLAHLALRSTGEVAEFGAHGYGPDAARLAEELAEQVRVWDRYHRGGLGPRITIHPAGDAAGPGEAGRLPDGRVIARRHVRVAVRWPSPTGPGFTPRQRYGTPRAG